jgi:hypothetical protein
MSGYRRTWLWNTGFTNYRFAIPYYAGYQGRAIYNDVDQTYHADPAELFDMDMGDHAVLAVSRTDTSVMLMDCERMQKFWTLEKAQSRRKYPLIAAVQAQEDAYGLMKAGMFAIPLISRGTASATTTPFFTTSHGDRSGSVFIIDPTRKAAACGMVWKQQRMVPVSRCSRPVDHHGILMKFSKHKVALLKTISH